LEDFTLAIELKPDSAQAYMNRGIAFRAEKMIDDAGNDFKKFLEFSPKNTRASIQVKQWLKKQGIAF
jgi:tetratricopeptide (TPR) repeat protein